ncbi:MAG: SDR family oxidoreductase [Actinomycetota bacterium]
MTGPRTDLSNVLAPDANAGRNVLVTGGGTGIGRAVAHAFARTGAAVAICGRRPEPLEATRSELEAIGARCVAISCDVREPDRVSSMLDEVLEAFGSVDVLVNNAGGQFSAPAEDISTNGWRAVHRLTVEAAWNLTREVVTRSMMPAGGGSVTFIGFSPRRGIPGFAHASAARAALEALASGLALEWSRYAIRTNCVALGAIDTEGLASYGPEEVESARRQVPLGRLGRPEEAGAVVAFLATDAAAYVTGTTITVDGGVDAWGQAAPPPEPTPSPDAD